jgi:hypothetical protein
MAGIGGTVIQRSFVANDVGNIIHIATAPVEELDLDDSEPTTLLAEIIGAPIATIFSEEEYRSYQRTLARAESPRRRDGGSFRARGVRFTGRSEDTKEGANQLFEDFVLYVSSTSSQHALPGSMSYPYFYDYDFFHELGPAVDIDKLILAADLDKAWFFAKDSNIDFIREIENYEIPLGQSPAIKSDSLLTLLESSRKFCVAPLAVGGAQAISQLSQGHYVGALLTTGTAGAMTLILIGTVSVGAMLVQRVAQARAKRGREGTDDDRTPTPRSGSGQGRVRSASAPVRSRSGTAIASK